MIITMLLSPTLYRFFSFSLFLCRLVFPRAQPLSLLSHFLLISPTRLFFSSLSCVLRVLVQQAVKDVLQSLVDDGLVTVEKIGTSNFYWSFPSAVQQAVRTQHHVYETGERAEKMMRMRERGVGGIWEAVILPKLAVYPDCPNINAAAARTTETFLCMIAGEADNNNNGLNYLLRFQNC